VPLPYFAYGSNLDPDQMAERCPGAVALGPARLDGWQLRIGHRGVATIVPEPGWTVWGGLWRVTGPHLATLDRHEGVALGRYRRETTTVRRDDEPVDAVVYVEPFSADAAPRVGYLERIERGGRWFGLPADHTAHLPRRA
jgi:gamma-glutamylcyclotransferase (GGCT)/AIG2-like uncharacterized protein YtfP